MKPDDIVIFEDDPKHQKGITEALTRLGLTVHAAHSVSDVEEFAARGTRLFVLDIVMKEIGQEDGGILAISTIRKVNPNAFVAIYTGHLATYKELARSIGADIVLGKSGFWQVDMQAVLTSYLLRQARDAEVKASIPESLLLNDAAIVVLCIAFIIYLWIWLIVLLCMTICVPISCLTAFRTLKTRA